MVFDLFLEYPVQLVYFFVLLQVDAGFEIYDPDQLRFFREAIEDRIVVTGPDYVRVS
jgi:hypothetical protein